MMPVQRKSDKHEHGAHGGHAQSPLPATGGRRTSLKTKTNYTVTRPASSTAKRGSKDLTKSSPERKRVDQKRQSQNDIKVKERQPEVNDKNSAKEQQEQDWKASDAHAQDEDNIRTRFMTPGGESERETTQNANSNDLQEPPPPEQPPQPPQPEVYSFEKFNKTMDGFADVFSSNKFMNVTDDYPIDDLTKVIADVTESLDEYKSHVMNSQRHLEGLQNRMCDVKERIRANIQARSNAVRADNETQTIEQRELSERLARLNTQVAHANTEVTEAVRLQTETERAAEEAQLAVEKAKEDAQNIQEEIAFRNKVEERRREHEKIKMEEERKRQEEERIQEEERRKQKEDEWKRKEFGSEKTQVWEKWPTFEYKVEHQDATLTCIIRGHPDQFNQNTVTCRALDQLECPVTFHESEELISPIIDLSGDRELQDKIVVCIPFRGSKQSAHAHTSRESVMKMEHEGHWKCLDTRETTFDHQKDYKYAVAEVTELSRLAVFSRLKRDYATVSSRGGKVASTYDQRISLTIPKDCIDGKDHILMEVKPVDSGSVNELKQKSPSCKGLLTSSPIVHMEWESTEFSKPVTVTVPCPPNPVKAKKLAAMRKEKEEKMKNPHKITVLLPHEIEALEKEKAKSKLQKMQEQIAEEENKVEEPKPTKWYMGEYANNDEDENDNLFLVSAHGNNRWCPVENVNISQVKLDLLQFDLDKPLEKFMVLRTKTSVDEDTIGSMANEVSSFLSQKYVQVILKQKSDDPFDTVMSVVPTAKVEKTMKKLSDEGYDDGPDASQVLSINEGDIIEVGFRGNVTNKDQEGIQFVYNSNIESETEFYACEVDKYLQKSFPVYRGVVEVYRKFKVKSPARRRRKDSSEDREEPPAEYKREMMCEMAINIPKYHVEQNSSVHKAPITIRNTSDPVNENLVRYIAEELGDEWRMVASYLNVSKPRVQAIVRNMQYGEQSDADARYDMLMTWLKKTPKATDKVACLSSALMKSGRGDIAEYIREQNRAFREEHKAH